uniref:Uncharacterized protein n=1 Tax=Peronospora matthiolae TaxID=2874970 RepID=A0AAV1VKX4_9STRA
MACGGQRACGKGNEQRGSEGAELHRIGRGVCSNIAWLADTGRNQVLIWEILSTNGKRRWSTCAAAAAAFGWVLHEV